MKIGLTWIVVKDIQSAIEYYTRTVGLSLLEFNEQYGWAELQGSDGGSVLGLAQETGEEKAGQNAVFTLTVENLEEKKASMLERGATPEGDVLIVPNQVKMQTIIDPSGNKFQLCELLNSSSPGVS